MDMPEVPMEVVKDPSMMVVKEQIMMMDKV